MHTLKSFATVFCFYLPITFGIWGCGTEPQKPVLDAKTKDTIQVPISEVTKPVAKDSLAMAVKDTEAPKDTNASKSIDKIALAAQEANLEITEEEALREREAVRAKRAKEKEERRAKRRAERKKKEAERKKKEEKKKRRGNASIEFKKTVYNYGRITQGEKVKHNFVFTNTGNKELVISNATATCGCTQPSFPFIPIAPGEEGYIGVVFDSKGRLGRQKPKVTITTNAKPVTYDIFLEGYVDSPEKEEEGNKDKEEETKQN